MTLSIKSQIEFTFHPRISIISNIKFPINLLYPSRPLQPKEMELAQKKQRDESETTSKSEKWQASKSPENLINREGNFDLRSGRPQQLRERYPLFDERFACREPL